MKKIRVFISSPGDVTIERNAARKILADIEKAYSDSIEIETLMWEDMPLEATGSFQSGIDYYLNQEPIDIAIFIVWRRIGSVLGQGFVKPDGTQFTGTEYEFEVMRRMRNEKNTPRILFYQKTSPSQVNYDDIVETARQKIALDAFYKHYFTNEATGESYARFQFDKTKDFVQQLNAHLLGIIDEMIGLIPPKLWDGNPYQGLQYFDEVHHPVFFGRGDIVYELSRAILNERKNVILLGESGSGKSSLVCAGLVPVIKDVLENEGLEVRYTRVTPSQFGTEIEEQISSLFAKHDMVFLDQFEELFSSAKFDKECRSRFIELLYSHVDKWRFVISMRSDFYTKFSEYPIFGELKNRCVVRDVPCMTRTELLEIIEMPAKMSGAQFEVRDGKPLSKIILEDAFALGNLPLTEFVLTNLFEHRDSNGLLTFEEYERMGKVKGAVVNYADGVFGALREDEKRAFFELLGSMVKVVTSGHERSIVRMTPLLETIVDNDSVKKNVVDKMVNTHLFVSDKDGTGRATVTIVHEELLRSWNVITQWIEQNYRILEQRDRIEDRATHWRQSGNDKRRLLRDTLNDVEFFKMKYGRMLSDEASNYIEASLHYSNRWSRRFNLALMLVIMLSSVVGIVFPRLSAFGSFNLPCTLVTDIFYAFSFIAVTVDFALMRKRTDVVQLASVRFILWLAVFFLSCLANAYNLVTYSPSDVENVWFSYFPRMFFFGELLFPFIVFWQATLNLVKYLQFRKIDEATSHLLFFKRIDKAKQILTMLSIVALLFIFLYGTVVVPKNFRLRKEMRWKELATESITEVLEKKMSGDGMEAIDAEKLARRYLTLYNESSGIAADDKNRQDIIHACALSHLCLGNPDSAQLFIESSER